MSIRTWIAAIVTTLLIAGCAVGPAPTTDRCAGWQPIRPTKNEWALLTRETARQIIADNEFGARLGCWTPNE